MLVEPRIEKPTREMLFHAFHGELAQLEAAIEAVGDETYAVRIIPLCMLAAAYIAVDVSGRWPTDADVREISRHTASSASQDKLGFELREQDVYDYLSRGALGFKPIEEVFPDPGQGYTLPVLITGQMLVAFRLGDGHDLSGYLDTVWNAANAAEHADLSLLPALMIRSQRIRLTAKNQ